MRSFLALLLCSILFSCHDAKKDYPIPSKKEINEVVKAIVIQDTLHLDTLPLNVDLGRPWREGGKLFYHLDVTRLLDPKNHAHFKKTDSLYLFFQCHISQDFKIDEKYIPHTLYTSETEIERKRTKSRHEFFSFYYYQMSRPLFSLDQKEAYVVIDIYYNYMAGEGYEFFLKKINGKWEVVWQDMAWIS